MLSPEEDIARSEIAKELLNHPLIIGFFKDFEERLIKEWRASDSISGKELREEIHRTLKVLDSFGNTLKNYVQLGKIAQHTLEMKEKNFGSI